MDFSSAVLSDHAQAEAKRREISTGSIFKVLCAPDSVQLVREGRIVAQGRIDLGDPPRQYLLRVFVDIDRNPPKVVTVYRTSKIAKYAGAS